MLIVYFTYQTVNVFIIKSACIAKIGVLGLPLKTITTYGVSPIKTQ